jgi:acetyltransferase-like isoleucine patch superfamily enzyme
MVKKEFKKLLLSAINNQDNPFHPFAFINGKPKIGKNVCIGFFSEVNAKNAKVTIGDDCDIASFVAINAADSHKRCIDLAQEIERKDITLENNVFIGSHCFIGGGVYIGHHSVIGAGTIISKPCDIPPFSLVVGNPPVIKNNYYKKIK